MGYHILIIDDKEVFRRKIKRLPYFKQNEDKFTISFEAQNGLEALEIIRRGGVDVTLTDIRMPIVDGIELLKTISRERLCKCTVLLSEYADFTYAKEGILNGAFDYIVKPIDNEKIQACFDRAYEYLKAVNVNIDLLAKKVEALADWILNGAPGDLAVHLEQIAESVSRKAETPKDRLFLANQLLDQLRQAVCKRNPDVSRFLPVSDICRIKPGSTDADDWLYLFRQQVMLLKNNFDMIFIKPKNHLVQKVCDFIIHNIDHEISLKAISEQFYVEKKYLSSLFRKEAGVGFVEYTTIVKMERAKILLSDPERRIYEVATMLGYSDKDYFSRLFKKYTCTPPSAFKEGAVDESK